MSAAEELLKNLMERAGIKKSKKRSRDMAYIGTSEHHQNIKWQPNSKMRHVSSNTDLTSSEVNTTEQVVKG